MDPEPSPQPQTVTNVGYVGILQRPYTTVCRLYGPYLNLSWTLFLPSVDPTLFEFNAETNDRTSPQVNQQFSSILFEH